MIRSSGTLVGVLMALCVVSAHAQKIQKIRLKLSEKAAARIEGKQFKKDPQGNVLTEVSSLDLLNTRWGANDMRRVFPHAGKFEERHRKHGLHLWYEIAYSKDNLNLSGIVRDYSQVPEVLIAEEVREKKLIDAIRPLKTPPTTVNDPYFSNQWHYHNTGQSGGTAGADISLQSAWDIEAGDDDVIVAIIDGGLDPNHADLQATVWINQSEYAGSQGVDDDGNGYVDDVNGFNFVYNSGTIEPHYHGVHVAGTVAAVNNNGVGVSGVAGGTGTGDGVRTMSCQVFASGGADGFDVAFVYAADNGAVISQNSWGYTSPGYYEQSVLDAIDYFIDNAGYDVNGNPVGPMQGGIVIFAAGNSSSSADHYPAYYEKVLAVAATDHNDQVAYFSNYGTWVDISAPGVDVYSTYTNNTYDYLSGTSMACPHVSGAAALVVSRFPGISPEGVRQRLTYFADSIDSQNPSYVGLLGAGRLNAFNSLQEEDSIAPSAIDDLSYTALSHDKVKLTWTATGASDTTGTASGYIIKYSTVAIDDSNFDSATTYPSAISPKNSGETELLQVSGLTGLTTYYFAIKAFDFSNNISPISNVISFTTTAPPVIDVSPDSIEHHMYSGKTDTLMITVGNTGEGILEVTPSIQVTTTSMVSQELHQSTQGSYARISDPDTKKVSEVLVRPFTYTGPSLTGVKVGIPSGSSGDFTAFTSELAARGAELVFLSDVGGAAWQGLDIIFIDDYYFYSFTSEAIADIRDHIAAGNGLFIVGDNQLSENAIDQILDGTGLSSTYVGFSDTYITDIFEHPTTQNVNTIYSPAYGMYYTAADQSKVLMNDDYGRPHAVATAFGGGRVLAFGNEITFFSDFSDNDLFLHQAVDWLADVVQFISVPDQQFNISAGDTVQVPLYFDTEGVIGGEYYADVVLHSNDPLNDAVNVPVHLTVTGSPSIEVDADSIDFGEVFITTASEEEFTIANAGTDELQVTIDFDSDSIFTISDTTLTIAPGDEAEVLITFTPQADSLYSRLVSIYSNDPEDSVLYVAVAGQGVYPPVMQVSPDSISETIYYNGSSIVNITIDNTGGGSVLEFIVSKHKDGEEIDSLISSVQQTFDNSKGHRQKALVEGKLTEFAVTSKTQVASYTVNPSVSDGRNILILTDYYSYANNIISHLNSLNRFSSISYVDVSYTTPTLEFLSAYDAILIHASNATDFTTLGNNLADYVDAGGGVVSALFEVANSGYGKLQGRWETGNYRVMNWSYYQSNYNLSLDIAGAANHSLMKDVNSFSGGYYSYSPASSVTLTTGSVAVADWSNGIPLIAYKSIDRVNRVDLGFFPVSGSYNWGYWDPATDGAIIMANALDFAGRTDKWLKPLQTEGSVNAGDAASLEVLLDGEGMDPGTYDAMLYVAGNDPSNSLDSVFFTLEILAAPDIELTDSILVMDTTFVNYSSTKSAVITNTGTDDLSITNVYASDSAFTVSPSTLNIAAGEQDTVTVTFNPVVEQNYEAILYFVSDDPDEDTVSMQLTGVALDQPVIEYTPSSLEDSLPTGYTDTLYVHISNTGGSDLRASLSFSETGYAEPAVARVIARINSLPMARDLRDEKPLVRLDKARKEDGAFGIAGIQGDVNSAGLNVAVLGAENSSSGLMDAVNKIYATGKFASVSYINLYYYTPTLSEVSAFDAVMVFSNFPYANNTQVGNVLADYVDNGGGVVASMFEHGGSYKLGGRWYNEHYYLIDQSSVSYGPRQYLGTYVSSPILEGVSSFDGGAYSYRPSGTSIAEGAELVASWTDGKPLVVTKTINGTRRVDLGMFPISSDYYYESWNPSTDGALLMANALIYSATADEPWVSFVENEITVPEGGSVDVPVIFSSVRKPAGTYSGTVNITSNDPVNGLTEIPATLVVTPASDIDLSTDPITFDTLFANIQQQSVDLLIRNEGSESLTVDFVFSDSLNFHAAPVTVEPFSEEVASITFAPQTEAYFSETVSLITNDPKETEISISLFGVAIYAPVMTVSPDSIQLTVDAGYSVQETMEIGNVTGLSDLNWNAAVTYTPAVTEVPAPAEKQPITNKQAAAALDKYLAATGKDNVATADTATAYGWISLGETNGTVTPGNAQNFQVTLDGSSLLHGVYDAEISISSNDPVNGYKRVPVWLNVIGKAEIYLSDTSLTFDPLFIGLADTAFVFIYNSGTKTLEMSVENTNDADYSYSLTDSAIAPYNWAVLQVIFAPTAAGALNGQLIISTNDETDPVVTVDLSGTGVEPPVANVDPGEISVYVVQGTTSATQFTIQNDGANDLTVSIPEYIQTSSYTPAGSGDDSANGDFGYQWIDSNDPGGPQFEWIDISSTGTYVFLSDDSYASVNLTFPFPFFGVDKSVAYISSNGYLAFNSNSASSLGPGLLNPYTSPTDLISALGRDLYPPSGNVIYHGNSERFIVTYQNVPNYSGYGTHTFQIILYASGKIKLQYLTTTGSSASEVGIEDEQGVRGIIIASYNNYITNNLAVEISGADRFITSINPAEVLLAPGESQTFDVALDATGLDTGSYTQVVNILTNDPLRQVIPYTVNMEVIMVPQFTSALSDTVDLDEGSSLAFQFEATNPRNSTLVFTLADSVVNAHMIESGLFQFDPDYTQEGLYQFEVRVDDGWLANHHTFWVRVNNVNRAPYVAHSVSSIRGQMGESVVINGYDIFADYDEEPLFFQAVSDQPELVAVQVLDSGRIEISFVSPGLVPVTLTAADIHGASVTELLAVESYENHGPVVNANMTDQYITLRDPSFELKLSDYFSDPDGDALEYSFVVSESPGDFTLTGDVLSFTATARGTVGVDVTATDTKGLGTISSSFIIYVENLAPELLDTLNNIVTYPTTETFNYDLAGYIFDFEGDQLTLTVNVADPAIAEGVVMNGVLSVNVLKQGETIIAVSVEDGMGGHLETSLTVTVNNRQPVALTPTFDLAISNAEVVDINLNDHFVDEDGDQLSFYHITTSSAFSVVQDGNMLTVGGTGQGTGSITVSATDDYSNSVTMTFNVTVSNGTPVNIIPFLDKVVTLAESPWSYMLPEHFVDPDNDAMGYVVSVDAPNVVDASILDDVLTVNALSRGSALITVTATDALGNAKSVSFHVDVVNREVINDVALTDLTTWSSSGPVEVSLSDAFIDADNDPLTYTAEVVPSNIATASISGGVLTLTVSEAGTATVKVTASDGFGVAASDEFSLTVLENTPPVLTGTFAPKVATLSTTAWTYDLATYFEDPEGETLTYTVTVDQAGIVTHSIVDNILTVTPAAKGVCQLLITATDPHDESIAATLDITVENQPVVVVGQVPDFTGTIDENEIELALESYFADADQDPLTYTVTSSPDGFIIYSLADNDLVIEAQAVGTATVTITASDAVSTVEISFTVTITNSPPVLAEAFDPKVATLSTTAWTYDLATYFNDPEGETLTYTATVDPDGIVEYDIDNNILTVTPASRGACQLLITATDSHNESITATLDITVENQPVVLAGQVPDFTGTIDENEIELALESYFSDADQDLLTYTVTSSVDGFIRYSVAGNDLTIDVQTVGTATVTLTASDDFSSVETSFTVTITNQAPVLRNTMGDVVMVSGDDPDGIDLEMYFGEPDDEEITYSVESSVSGLATLDVSNEELSISAVATGTTQLTVTAADPHGATVSQSFQLTIKSQNNEPALIRDFEDVTVRLDAHEIRFALSDYFADDDALTYSVVVEDEAVLDGAIIGDSLHLGLLKLGESLVVIEATDPFGERVVAVFTVHVVDHITAADDSYQLTGISVYPNPASDRVVISYTVRKAGTVRIQLLDSRGRMVADIHAAEEFPGNKEVEYHPATGLHGLFFIRCQSAQNTEIRKVVFQ